MAANGPQGMRWYFFTKPLTMDVKALSTYLPFRYRGLDAVNTDSEYIVDDRADSKAYVLGFEKKAAAGFAVVKTEYTLAEINHLLIYVPEQLKAPLLQALETAEVKDGREMAPEFLADQLASLKVAAGWDVAKSSKRKEYDHFDPDNQLKEWHARPFRQKKLLNTIPLAHPFKKRQP